MQRLTVSFMRSGILFALVFSVSLLTLAGCGPSKEEQAKQDVEGKKVNDTSMQRMMQEQGRLAPPGPGGAPAPGGVPGTGQK